MVLIDMEGKYKRRLMTTGQFIADGQDLREQYEEEKKEELIIQRRSVVKLAGVCSVMMKIAMAVLALAGVMSLAHPELQTILIEIVLEAVREIKGF